MVEIRPTIRVDKWLWFARFFKTRGLATKTVAAGHLRLNGNKIAKPSVAVGEGDTLTFPQGRDIRVIRILAVGSRRGPASEAQTLYEDLSPPESVARKEEHFPSAPAYKGKGRPTKKDRRSLDLYRS